MSRDRRPQPMPRPGRQRAVLVVPRDGTEDKRHLTRALDEIARLGWVLAAVIAPADHLDALRMVLDGLADVVLASRPEHMPTLQFIYNLESGGGGRSQAAVRPVARGDGVVPDRRPAADHPWRGAAARRPEMVSGANETAERPSQRRSQLIRRSA
jgi:hypothetical protein